MPILGILGAVLGMLVMGAVLHVGQIRLLSRRHVLQPPELPRIEEFLWTSTVVAVALWMLSSYLVPNTVVFWLAAALSWKFLLLRQDGRAQLLSYVYQARAALNSHSTELSRSGQTDLERSAKHGLHSAGI
jgi:hypothetical protein